MELVSIEKYSKGELIIKEGEEGEKAYVINKGHVEIKKTSFDGNDVVITSLGPGHMFGEMCLFDDKKRSASAFALSDVELSVITKEEFLLYLKNTPVQIKIIIEQLLNRLRQTSNLVALLKMEDLHTSNKVQETLNNIEFPT